MLKSKQTPVILSAQTKVKKYYTRPDFQVIPLNTESPLLSGSTKPTSKKLPTVTPIGDGGEW